MRCPGLLLDDAVELLERERPAPVRLAVLRDGFTVIRRAIGRAGHRLGWPLRDILEDLPRLPDPSDRPVEMSQRVDREREEMVGVAPPHPGTVLGLNGRRVTRQFPQEPCQPSERKTWAAAQITDVGVAVVEEVELDGLAVLLQEVDEADDSPIVIPWIALTSSWMNRTVPPAAS